MSGFLSRIFRGRDHERARQEDAAWRLYRAAVDQARSAAFYTRYGVADSIDGRFDLIILHVILLIRRLRREDEPEEPLSQALFDATFADMDRSLREMGVGDLGVGKRVKVMAKAFYGRAQAYEAALDAGDRGRLSEALDRNIYGPEAGAGDAAEALADYVRAVDGSLAVQTVAQLRSGDVTFAPLAESAAS